MSLVELIELLSDTSFRPLKKVNEAVIEVDTSEAKSYKPVTVGKPVIIEFRNVGDEVYIDFDKEPGPYSMPLSEGFHVYLLKPDTVIYFKAVSSRATIYLYEWVTV